MYGITQCKDCCIRPSVRKIVLIQIKDSHRLQRALALAHKEYHFPQSREKQTAALIFFWYLPSLERKNTLKRI